MKKFRYLIMLLIVIVILGFSGSSFYQRDGILIDPAHPSEAAKEIMARNEELNRADIEEQLERQKSWTNFYGVPEEIAELPEWKDYEESEYYTKVILFHSDGSRIWGDSVIKDGTLRVEVEYYYDYDIDLIVCIRDEATAEIVKLFDYD